MKGEYENCNLTTVYKNYVKIKVKNESYNFKK